MEEPKSFKLSGVIKKVFYKNDETKFISAVLENNQRICGVYFDTDIEKIVGEEIVLTGNWVTHKKYGVQFIFDTLEIKEAELYFFLTKIVKGIGQKFAKELLEEYTEEELIKVLNETPEKLLKFKGIKEKKLEKIVSSWQKFQHLRELGSFLSKYGVSSSLITKIYSNFGEIEDIIEKIKENPYILIHIKGIGFKKADEIAKSLGIDERSEFRIMACLNYTLKEFCDNNGNSSIDKYHLYRLLDESLGFSNEEMLYENSIVQMLANEELFTTKENRVAISMLYRAEKKILEFFKRRKDERHLKNIVSNIDDYLEKKEKSLGFNLSPEQKKAVKLINEGQNTLFLIGYAGTGKSTSSRAILELLEEIVGYDDIITIALSGIASQRISDTTGYESCTIQSLLVKHKEKDFFPYKVVLLDEASMVNSVTFYQIISKISDDTIFIIVGDDGQLPAIGAGNILSDAIKYNLASICKLTKIYRQNENQAIAVIANDIRQGKVPSYKENYEDFKFIDVSIDNYYAIKNSVSSNDFASIRVQNSDMILNNILNISASYIERFYRLIKNKDISKALTLFQVITPMKNGTLGVENLNMQLQKLFNSSREQSVKTRLYEYKLSDKVIHIKNENMKCQTMSMYKSNSQDFLERRVFNGQLGLIIKLDFDEKKCIVLYPNDDMVVFYDMDDLSSLLSLAYCLTIHKTQGMEYDNALIPMSFSHYIMHNTKLLYTAITRAKSMCYIVGEDDAFKGACKRIETTIRESVINDLMQTTI
ncbi:exodeoxyribonuclease V subunit alpha [Malaciobacter canalis]|jgi:exodeoxyribonuclease V alpha subunit|uniref:Exodeoxyribonuclease V subunit alpha n=1 Tax=Malaciobacter canalis TaxID=1912871 RepID=A0ABX4LTZ7_9BACT|nr:MULTISPECIES: AAA family ATPase [Malaciobacter]PHO11050.1 exodeoxyribonuclease V subunit alpha [Malaciobacter canalis]QEE33129.1 helicase, RecD/TraA family (non-RecBCD) [Malaciobacter canalis]SKB37468.1 exodeoxyribonuclease V alpha subunit [Malaciobacter marinus]